MKALAKALNENEDYSAGGGDGAEGYGSNDSQRLMKAEARGSELSE